MSEEKQDIRPDDEMDDEMPGTGGAPCGAIFGATEAIYVTDADAPDIAEDAEQS
jgi:hypothetical protein